ncbi:GxxExxY protein [Niveibacterium terrae]|uniref:GxxExxY protein n=1 Tax=Niveibacterium terrae TaxID=3373598 RepID=UPI003A933502
MELNEISGTIIDAAIAIHKDLGPGLLESVYEQVRAKQLQKRGLLVERQRAVTFEYDGTLFEDAFQIDLLVEGQVVVELKSVEKESPVHVKQVLTYLRLMKLPLGLVINFGASPLKNGLHRVINSRASQPSLPLP